MQLKMEHGTEFSIGKTEIPNKLWGKNRVQHH